jgi:hypothetical protein
METREAGSVQLSVSNCVEKPPTIMRLPSNGGSLPIIRSSVMIFFSAASQVALSGQTIHENTTVSSGLAFTAILKSVSLPSRISSPHAPTWCVAPYSLKVGAAPEWDVLLDLDALAAAEGAPRKTRGRQRSACDGF